MAFGDLRGSLTASVNSVANPTNLSGSVAASVGDLVFGVFGQQTNLTATDTITDNLGNTYAYVNAGTDAGTVSIRCFYARVTVAGTLTQISVPASASTNDASAVADVIEGPFVTSPLDANPANATDATTPFTCPATGALAQANEVVMAAIAVASSQTVAATAPSTIGGTVPRNNASTGISRRTVTATTTVTPEFTGTSATAGQTTASFKRDNSAALSGSTGPTFTTAGVLSGSAALSGAATVAFTTAGTAQALSALSGSADIAFSAAGDISGAAALAGASSLAFTTSGILAGDAALSGTASVSFTATGAVEGEAALAGEAGLELTTSASLTIETEAVPEQPALVTPARGGGGPARDVRKLIDRALKRQAKRLRKPKARVTVQQDEDELMMVMLAA